MDMAHFILFFTASWILIITPGPDMIYVITRGVSLGRKAGVVSALGVTLGILVHTFFAAFGLAVILQTSALAFFIVKHVGAAYLIYIGIQSFRDQSGFVLNKNANRASLRSVFIQGVFSNVLNPKVALFFLAFLPQFVRAENGNPAFQMCFLGITFALFGVVFLLFLGYFSGNMGKWLSQKQGFTKKIKWFTGSVLIALGLRLAFMERK
jgi:threonine/homoserine/homoserine lactone efflux protein